jgi:hypothetical protein
VERPGTDGAAVDPFSGEYSISITNCKSQQQTLSIRIHDVPTRRFAGMGEFLTIKTILQTISGRLTGISPPAFTTSN